MGTGVWNSSVCLFFLSRMIPGMNESARRGEFIACRIQTSAEKSSLYAA